MGCRVSGEASAREVFPGTSTSSMVKKGLEKTEHTSMYNRVSVRFLVGLGFQNLLSESGGRSRVVCRVYAGWIDCVARYWPVRQASA